MSYHDYPPKLTVTKTLSHPADPARVIGFEGRNTVLGTDALVLKGDELPVVRSQRAVTHYVVPIALVGRAVHDDLHVYIVGEVYVYYADPFLVESAVSHTGTKYDEIIEGRKLPVNELTRWSREDVEVSN